MNSTGACIGHDDIELRTNPRRARRKQRRLHRRGSGRKAFVQKFQTFLNIFKMNFVILADGDAEKIFESQDAVTLTTDSLSPDNDLGNKTIYILEKDLEHLLACLDQGIYDECERLYEKKPERSYHFIKRLLAENPDAARTAVRIARLIGGTNDSGSF